MYCIYCGRLCDYDETHACEECRHRVEKNNERVYLLSLLADACGHVPVYLRRKIEKVLQVKDVL